MKRRELMLGGALSMLLSRAACAQSRREFIDAAKRRVALPARVERIYAAGPPASILVFAIAPDKSEESPMRKSGPRRWRATRRIPCRISTSGLPEYP